MELPLTTKGGWEKGRTSSRHPSVRCSPLDVNSSAKRRARTMDGARHGSNIAREGWERKISQVYQVLGGGQEVRVGLLAMVVGTSGLFEKKGEGRKFVAEFLGRTKGSVGKKELRRVIAALGKKVWLGARKDAQDGEIVDRVCSTLIAAKFAMGKTWNVGVFLTAMESEEMAAALQSIRKNLSVLFNGLAQRSPTLDDGDMKEPTVEYQYVRVLMEEMRMAPSSEARNSKFERDLVACLAHRSNSDNLEWGSTFVKALSKRRLTFDEFIWCVSFYAFDAYGDRQNCLGKPRILSGAVSSIVHNICEGFFRVVTSPRKSQPVTGNGVLQESLASFDLNPSSPIMNKPDLDLAREPASGESHVRSPRMMMNLPESGSVITPEATEGSSATPQKHLDFALNVVEESIESDSLYVETENSRVQDSSKFFDDEYEFQFVDDIRSDDYNSDKERSSLFYQEPTGYASRGNHVDATTMCAYDDAREKYDMVANDVQHIITDFSLVGEDLVKVVDQLKGACNDIISTKEQIAKEMTASIRARKASFLERGYRAISGLSTMIVFLMIIVFAVDYFSLHWSFQFSYTSV